MPKAGDVVIIMVQFADGFEVKKRPALVLCEEFGNVVVAGITSNLEMKGIPLSKEDGAIKDSVIKLNYLYTTSKHLILKVLFHLTPKKKEQVFNGLVGMLEGLKKRGG